MILKISKSLTIALLLAVSFNNSYATNNMDLNNNNMEQNEYSMDDIIEKLKQGNISEIDFRRMLRSVANRLTPMVRQMQSTLNATIVLRPGIQFIGDQNNPQINVNITFDFPDNNNSDAENVPHNANNMNINDIITELRSGNVSQDRREEILDIINDLINPIIQHMKLTLMANNYGVNINIQLRECPQINVKITFDFPDNNNSDAENIRQILSNLENNNDVNTTVKQFFSNYIGDNFSNIFNINDNQALNDIKSILTNNVVTQHLTIGAIREALNRDIRENHKHFFKGANDSDSGNPYSAEEFKESYRYIMEGIIQMRMDKINNIRNYLNSINTGHNQIKQDIKDSLNQCIQNRLQYLNNILQEITSDNHINNVYQDYIAYYENDNADIINNHIPVL